MNLRLITTLALCAFVFSGCMVSKISETDRTAVEQLLLSTAADRSLENMVLESLADKKVFFDPGELASYDRPYVVGQIRDVLGRSGALLAQKEEDAEIRVEARAGALAIDRTDSLIGIPSVHLPIPFASEYETPEIAIVKRILQRSEAKIALHGFDRATGEQVISTGGTHGSSFFSRWTVMVFISFTRTDIPEKQ